MAMVLNSMGVPPAARMPRFDVDGEIAQLVVAVHRLGPGVGDADDGLAQIFVGEADGLVDSCGPGRAEARAGWCRYSVSWEFTSLLDGGWRGRGRIHVGNVAETDIGLLQAPAFDVDDAEA